MRKPSVTRTISTLNITVLGMDTVLCEPMTMTFPIYESEAPKDEDKLFKYIRRMYETDNFKISAITGKELTTRTYTMSLRTFIEESEKVEEVPTHKVDETQTADTVQ